MSCGGRGICGCGRPRCAEREWWFHFCGAWWMIAWAMTERAMEGKPREPEGRWSDWADDDTHEEQSP